LEYFSWENLKRVGFKISQENFPGKFKQQKTPTLERVGVEC
jgi:hypothetical protein